MTDIFSAVSQGQGQAPTSGQSTTSQASLNQDFDSFLRLLTTQLQNQDPLEPMDTSEFTNQLVQFSQVEQQIRTNQQLEDLVFLQDLSLTSIALSYIGLNVEVQGNEIAYQGEGNSSLGYQLPPGGANNVQVLIQDENGTTIRTLSGTSTGGKHKIAWDGKDEFGNQQDAGNYKVSVTALDGEGKPLQNVPTYVTRVVDGVETVDGQLLLTSGDLFIPYSSIISASAQDKSTVASAD